MNARTAVQAPPEGLSFEHVDSQTGGTKHPIVRQLRAVHPERGVLGELDYYPPGRSDGKAVVDSLYVYPGERRQGVGSALVDELQRRHPDSTIVHSDRSEDGQKWWDGYTEDRSVKRGRTAMSHRAGEEDYRLQHGAPDESSAPLHDIESAMPDIHEHPEYYRHGTEGEDESLAVIHRVRNRPDAKVHIYRAIPAEHAHKGFKTGDWVSTSPSYARQHARANEESGADDWPVIRTTVPAKHLQNDGDPTEYGYTGPDRQTAMVHFKGGRNQEVRQHADGVVRKVVRRPTSPVGGYTFHHYDHREYDQMHQPPRGRVDAYGPDESYAGHLRYGPEGTHVEIDPEHQHLADELERRMRMKMPKEGSMMDRTAVHLGFVDPADRSRVVPGVEPGLPRIVAHVSGNSIDIMHCPFCGSGAVLARSDGTVECNFCTSVFTVQVQPQFAAFPQTAEGMPYQWPGQPGLDQLAGGGDGAMGGFPGPVAGEPDSEADDNPFGASADDEGEEGDADEAAGGAAASDDVEGTKAQVGGKDAPPFTKKKSYRTAAGYQLDRDEYLRHLAISAAHHRGKVARLVRESR